MRADYIYTGETLSMEITDDLTVDPACTPTTFSCSVVFAPRYDICSVDEPLTTITFDTTTGELDISSTDRDGMPEGSYILSIQAFFANSDRRYFYVVSFDNTCLDVQLVALDPGPFESDTIYELRDPALGLPWTDFESFATVDYLPPECGSVLVSFFEVPSGDNINTDLFEDFRDPSGNYFRVKETSVKADAGLYSFKYRLELENEPDLQVTGETFTIEILDPCAGPLYIEAPYIDDIYYVIGDDDNVFELDSFYVEPDYCAMTITFTIYDADAFEAAALTVEIDEDHYTTVTLDKFMDISFVGEYYAELVGKAGDVVEEEDWMDFYITIEDPCAGPLPITPPTIDGITYKITDLDNVFVLPPFEIVPVDCAMSIIFSVDDTDFRAAALTVAVAADTSTTWTLAQFMSRTYAGTYTATLTATAGAQIPEQETVTFTITIIDSCAGPLPITPPTIAEHTYLITDEDNVFVLPPFEVEPSDCEMSITFSVDDASF